MNVLQTKYFQVTIENGKDRINRYLGGILILMIRQKPMMKSTNFLQSI